jgi:hypothetical protein
MRTYIHTYIHPYHGRVELVPEMKSSILLSSIKSIKIGSGKLEGCISIVSTSRTLLIKIEDKKMYIQMLGGFILVTENNRNK